MLERGLAQLTVPSELNVAHFDFGAFLLALPAEATMARMTGQDLAHELAPTRIPHEMDRRFLLEFLLQMSVYFGASVEGIPQGEMGLTRDERSAHEDNQR